jgi:hypothetical protein
MTESLRRQTEEIFEFTDAFCAQHLDAEYAELCRRLVARLARKRPSPLVRGDLRTWAGAVIQVVGSLNFLFDRTQHPHLTAHQLSTLTGIPNRREIHAVRMIPASAAQAHRGTYGQALARVGLGPEVTGVRRWLRRGPA